MWFKKMRFIPFENIIILLDKTIKMDIGIQCFLYLCYQCSILFIFKFMLSVFYIVIKIKKKIFVRHTTNISLYAWRMILLVQLL